MEKQRGCGAAEGPRDFFAAEPSKLPVKRLRGQNPQLLFKNQRLSDQVSPAAGSIVTDSIRDNVAELVRRNHSVLLNQGSQEGCCFPEVHTKLDFQSSTSRLLRASGAFQAKQNKGLLAKAERNGFPRELFAGQDIFTSAEGKKLRWDSLGTKIKG